MKLDHVVFGGGGMHGVMYLGALIGFVGDSREVYDTWRHGLKAVAGTSVGALIGYLVTVWNPWRILEFVKQAGFQDLNKGLFNRDWTGLSEDKALNSGKELNALLRKGMLDTTGSEEATFEDVYKLTGVTFIVTVTNSGSGHTQYLSHINSPKMLVWMALRASVSLPYVFPEFKIGAQKYIDGGVTCNLPCHLFPAHRTLTLFVQPKKREWFTPGALIDFYSNAAQLGSFRVQPLYALNSIPCIPGLDTVSAYNFGASNSELDSLFMQGVKSWNAVVFRNSLLYFLVCYAMLRHRVLLPDGGSAAGL